MWLAPHKMSTGALLLGRSQQRQLSPFGYIGVGFRGDPLRQTVSEARCIVRIIGDEGGMVTPIWCFYVLYIYIRRAQLWVGELE